MEIQDLNNISKSKLSVIGIKMTAKTILSRGRNFIYAPRSYDSNPEYEKWKESLEPITYKVGQLSLKAWLDTDTAQPPERVWLMFGGNGSVALDWLPITSFAPPSRDAFVLFDYPGFGDNAGKPNRKLIKQCVDALITTILERLSIQPEEIETSFRVMGHSLGCAIALETASRYSITQGILVAPFTSIREIGSTLFWKPLTYLAADPYNNYTSLTNLPPDSKFHIIHGTDDEIIPLQMGRTLHQASKGKTSFWQIPEADHNEILLKLSEQLGLALTNGGDFEFK